MLVEAPYQNGDVITMKSAGGEEIIARLIVEDNGILTVSKPMTAVVHEQGIGMLPYLMTVSPNTNVKLNRSGLSVVAKTAKEIADEYTRQTSNLSII
jgi:hypothetical protein